MMETGAVALLVVAVVEGVKDFFPSLTGNQTRIFAAGIGFLLGYFGLYGLTIETGLLAGLMAVGGHTLASSRGETIF